MKIRKAETRDIGRVTELLYQVHQVHADGRPDLFIPGCKKYTEGELLEIFEEDMTPVYVAEDENGLVLGYAFCIVEVTENEISRPPMKTLYIDDLCVDAKSRGQHVGSALYEYVCQQAKEMGCYHLTLNVWELNTTARKFYESMGLVPLKTTMEKIL